MTNETQISEKKQKKEKVVKEKNSSSDKPTSDKPTSDKPTSDKLVNDKPTSDKPTSDKAKKPAKEKVVKKVAKVKDGPKKNLTSYMWFCGAERKNIKNENKELSSKAVISELALRWRKLKEGGADKLKIYEKMAQDDKERYIKEKEKLASKVEVIAEVENESEAVPTLEVVTPEVVVPEVAQQEDKKVKKTKNKKK